MSKEKFHGHEFTSVSPAPAMSPGPTLVAMALMASIASSECACLKADGHGVIVWVAGQIVVYFSLYGGQVHVKSVTSEFEIVVSVAKMSHIHDREQAYMNATRNLTSVPF
ncbi:hypothetical protein EVG20_g7444 [Dentipellis fragilis]|uniref:Uncharacterized protein n=1 Tax=Dentipellis fragilis TaxID=205917 RepID=A0A4Y9YHD5_9AGAM|nr:hypothetical protein EVG20_g7444 [Dentipellis fragilis]